MTLLRAVFVVTPDSTLLHSVPHRGDRPLRGVRRGLSTSAGDAVLVSAPPYTKMCMEEASLYGGQCRFRCCCLRRDTPMRNNHWIDNCPTVEATPSGKLMVTRPEPFKILKLLTHQ